MVVGKKNFTGETRREMDESWRMQMGLTSGLPRRRSMEDRSSSLTRQSIFSNTNVSESETLDADDFADVFGGPPKSLLKHKFTRSSSFYAEIFKQPAFTSPALTKGGRSLPARFRVPAKNDAFYGDIFGSDDDRRSRERSGSQSKAKSKSKSNSSSALSSEELSPLRPAISDDVALSAFTSKLSQNILSEDIPGGVWGRGGLSAMFYFQEKWGSNMADVASISVMPIKVPYKWNSSTLMHEEQQIKQKKPIFACNGQSFEFQCQDNGHSKKVTSPETISVESNSYQSIKLSTDDWELSPPFSSVSGVCQEPDQPKSAVHDHVLRELVIELDDDDDEDEVMSSYVIEVNSKSNLREENCGTEAIDEAIAWAKEKFQSRNNEESAGLRNNGNEETAAMGGRPCVCEYHDDDIGMIESPKKVQTETEKLDIDIRLWSSDKETDIRLLLSTLHNILCAESGWSAVPYMSLIESSQVKKAYQKARLCLHPDKLQQRGATLLQKYIADKAFSILQIEKLNCLDGDSVQFGCLVPVSV
ncbi:auxilin-related protein 2-like [Trifolium pratense]|uniref:Auxilin-related protein 2-like n=1 Tax=Trifolium pratense TaxID=57577 RepID=A0A2K3NRA6_TRIPR|nr:auxilin-related protein 2-like [Trifolium pratense]